MTLNYNSAQLGSQTHVIKLQTHLFICSHQLKSIGNVSAIKPMCFVCANRLDGPQNGTTLNVGRSLKLKLHSIV